MKPSPQKSETVFKGYQLGSTKSVKADKMKSKRLTGHTETPINNDLMVTDVPERVIAFYKP